MLGAPQEPLGSSYFNLVQLVAHNRSITGVR